MIHLQAVIKPEGKAIYVHPITPNLHFSGSPVFFQLMATFKGNQEVQNLFLYFLFMGKRLRQFHPTFSIQSSTMFMSFIPTYISTIQLPQNSSPALSATFSAWLLLFLLHCHSCLSKGYSLSNATASVKAFLVPCSELGIAPLKCFFLYDLADLCTCISNTNL